MSKCQKIKFEVFFALVLIAICICMVFYRKAFNGDLSTDSNDWIAFSTLVGSIGTMLFTGLNVYVFYMLTSTIEEQKVSERKQKRQLEIINRFKRNVDTLFQFDENGDFVHVHLRTLQKLEYWLEELKNFSTLLPTLGKENYADFVSAFSKFCEDYKYPVDSEAWRGHCYGQRAFDLYKQALGIVSALLKDVEQTT